MKIVAQITHEYEMSIDSLIEFKKKCFEYIDDNYEECAIKSWDDISSDTIQAVITDALPAILDSIRLGYGDEGVVLDDYFNTISFNFNEESTHNLVIQCVEDTLTDIDYTPKFKQLLELSNNLKTGFSNDKETEFDETGFTLYSQWSKLTVKFNPALKDWKVDLDEPQAKPPHASKTGIGWNELVQFLCVDCQLTYFMSMTEEQIQKCKLWKVKV